MSKTTSPWNTKLDYDLGYLIYRAASTLKAAMQRSFLEHGLTITPIQWTILQKLTENQSLSQVELATMLEKDRPNITRIINVMEKNSLVLREADSKDGRKFLITLTKKGRETWEIARSVSLSIREKALSNFSEEELELVRGKIIQLTNDLK